MLEEIIKGGSAIYHEIDLQILDIPYSNSSISFLDKQ